MARWRGVHDIMNTALHLWRAVLAQIALPVASFCFALLLAEVLVRVFFPHSRDHITRGLFESDSLLGWRLVPGSRTTHQSSDFEVVYDVNELGFRDEPRRPTAYGRHRSLLYGDSQVFGWGVPAAERFTNLIERREPLAEMWNLAVPGYGLDQQILAYEKNGGSWNADEVVFFVSSSTLERTFYDYKYNRQKPRFVLGDGAELTLIPVRFADNEKQARMIDAAYRVFGWMYLLHFVDVRLGTLKERMSRSGRRKRLVQDSVASARRDSAMAGIPTPSAGFPADTALGTVSEMRARSVLPELHQRILQRGRDLAVSRGHSITLLTNLTGVDGHALEQFCRREQIRLLTIRFAAPESELRLGPHDPHWNRLAHREIAENLGAELSRPAREALRPIRTSDN
jgi:hypothetical protein